MIPNLGLGSFGPLCVMIGASFITVLFGLVVAPFARADRPHVAVRDRVTLWLAIAALAFAATASLSPYEGVRGVKCRAAIVEYGLTIDRLANLDDSENGCAVAGQLLLAYAMSMVLGVGVGSLLWVCSPDPVLDATGKANRNGTRRANLRQRRGMPPGVDGE